MILKNDQWQADSSSPTTADSLNVRGAINYRRVPHSSLYALSQPTQAGIAGVLQGVKKDMVHKGVAKKIVWINLREEPLIYINGTPYVLRQEAVSLRNVKVSLSSSQSTILSD